MRIILKKIYLIRANKTRFGGAEKYLSRMSSSMNAMNIDHKVVNSPFPKFFPSWLRLVLFNVFICFLKRKKLYFSLDRIVCPDIYRAGDGVHKVFLTKVKKSRLNPLHFFYLYIEKKCFQNAKHIIANSNMVKKEIIDAVGINENKISVIYNGIELNILKNNNSQKILRREFNLDEKKVFLFVGSGFERKGAKEFITIIGSIEETVNAFIVGYDKNIKQYENLAKLIAPHQNIIFTGAREDVDDFYQLSDFYILPTYYEPFSNTVLEAMNNKCAVFTTNANGASEILDEKFIMKTPTDFGILEFISYLLSSPEELCKIKEKNYNSVKNFSIENNLNKTLEVINEYSC